jgi:cytochrome c biogenesis protein CcmG/thiol:disulfide interchange protein DsbE
VYDGRGRIGIEYGYYGVPETFVIDRKGTVLARHAGELSEAQLRGYIEQVLR